MYGEKEQNQMKDQGTDLESNDKPISVIISIASTIGIVVSILCGILAWNLSKTEVYHKIPENSTLRYAYGIDGYHTTEYNADSTICIILLGILITVGVDIYIYIKNKNKFPDKGVEFLTKQISSAKNKASENVNKMSRLLQPTTQNSKADELIKLNELLSKGIISQEEFEKMKKELIN